MKNYPLLSLLLIIMLLGACSKKDTGEDTSSTNFKITMGVQCGWGSRLDSLSIGVNQAHLIQNFYTTPNNLLVVINSKQSLNTSEVNALKAAIDWNYFSSLNYNSGDLASDGCDVWLKIENGNQKHAIRFSFADTIPQLRPLTNQLDSIWSRMGDLPADMFDNF